MAKKNDDFFKIKKEWSKVKDDILACYFKPYVSKILHTYKPLVYVDCFAGKGRFDDGSLGSPLIALKIIEECIGSTTMRNPNVETFFIDLNYAADLKKNLAPFPNAKIISGTYEDNIYAILNEKCGRNIFLYIDPYGIKALQCSAFDQFARGQFNSIELLINLNSFGFIREACNALGTTFTDKEIFEDLVEYAPTQMSTSKKSVEELDKIAGGDYWQSIIEEYKAGIINGYSAEEQFAEKYRMRLMQSYRYVLNMPLRIKRGQRPKYRLIHATNHRDGCLLMVDNICLRWEALQEIQSGGQMLLWNEDYNNHVVDVEDLERKATGHFSKYQKFISLSDALADFFMWFGPICSTGDMCQILKNLESGKQLEVQRSPDVRKDGRPTSFMTEGKGKTVFVRWRA